ncbi:hypothetical protein L195_g062024, partial [Trifolium pratense]
MCRTELELLETNYSLKYVSEELERSCVLQGRDHGGEKSGIIEPKGCDHGDLVGYVSIVAEEVQDLE